MQRRALLTLLTACCAATAFAVGAAAFDGVVADTGSSVDGEGGPTANGSGGGTKDTRAARGSGSASDGCLACGLSARSLLDGLLPAVSPLLLAGLAAAALAGATLLGLRPGRDHTAAAAASDGDGAGTGERDRTTTPGPPDAAATNEVYRAWAALAERVDVATPETTTPGEYARAAIAAGLDRDAVERLTGLFESVRYGEASVTDERERTARATAERLAADEPAECGDGTEGDAS